MQWLDENHLATWAQRTDARTRLADMVSDLIRATISDASRFRFPGGDSGQVRGWDGDLETAESAGVVPEGKSKWEFGTGAGARKATDDYEKRTGKTSPEVMAENTLVLVNLEKWDTPRELLTAWEKDKTDEKKWRAVVYLDAVALVHWLDLYPAVAARYAREVLNSAPKEGALSTDEFWDEFSSQFKPQLAEAVVIGDRKEFAAQILNSLVGPPQSLVYGAETAEELAAFTVAAIRTAAPEVRRQLESMTLIVRDEAAARFLSSRSGLVTIVINGATPLGGVLSRNNVALSAATGAQARKHQSLSRCSATGMAEGFVAMGLDHEQGYELAQRCGRSLTVLRRLIPSGAATDPEWLTHATALKPAFLAGGWSTSSTLDREVVAALAGTGTYEALESVLLPTVTMADRPVDKVADVWSVRSPVDAFLFYGQQVVDADLQRLRTAVSRVFSHAVSQPSREQKFSLSYTPPENYSPWLRDGLALTLVIIATMHGAAGLHVAGKTPQQYVDEIVSGLPEWGRSHEVLVRLGDQTALFAEAAPNPFLSALESMLGGDHGKLRQVFQPHDPGLFGQSSPHVHLLWALEVLAWDPRYLMRSAVVLGRLAEIDPEPESNLVNRPLNSLKAILLSWAPNTHATSVERAACLDAVLRACPGIAWELLTKLLPGPGVSSPTQKPRLRDAEPKNPEVLTFGLVWDAQNGVVDRAIALAVNDPERLVQLIRKLAGFQPAARAAVLRAIDEYLTKHQTATGSSVWHELRSELSKHEYFSSSDWALAQEERAALLALLDKHQPGDPLAIDRRVFDDWLPQGGTYQEGMTVADPNVGRAEVIDRVLLREGIPGILRLATLVKLPGTIGPALRDTSVSIDQLVELLMTTIGTSVPGDLAYFASAVGADKFGAAWAEVFASRVAPALADDATRGRLLLGWPATRGTWAFAKSLGMGVEAQYWQQTNFLPFRESLDELLYAINRFHLQGRDLQALSLASLRLKELPTSTLLLLLRESIAQVPTEADTMGTMLSWYIGQGLAALRERNDVEETAIAGLEYAYLPLIRFEEGAPTVVGLLAKDPALFVEVLSHVFRPEGTQAEAEVDEQTKARARVSYDLLSSFKTTPGQVGRRVNSSVLAAWIAKARELAASKGLGKIADIQIGHVLAHAPTESDEATWPPAAVCELLEATASENLERGIHTECFNKRGVYRKSLNEGGGQERAFAERYKAWADAAQRYPRTSAMLSGIADDWLVSATREDVRAEKGKLKM